MIWKPNVTVAAIVRRDDKYLLVEEESQNGPVLNQPAGHLEQGESLIDAVIRETLEESACLIEPEHLIGTYLWHHAEKDTTFLRFTFSGQLVESRPNQPLDEGIIRALWMTREEIEDEKERLRSPVILQSIDDYLDGQAQPLSSIKHLCDPD